MIDLDAQVEGFLKHCSNEKRLNEKTVKAYKCDLKQFVKWLQIGGKPFEKECLRSYVAELNNLFAARTVKRKLASLRAFARYRKDEQIEVDNPFDELRFPIREPKRLPRTIGRSDLSHIFRKEIVSENYCATRNTALVEMLFSTGIRISEACALDVSDFDFTSKTLRIIGKGDKERVLHFENEDAFSALCSYLGARERLLKRHNVITDALFVSRQARRLTDQSARNAVKAFVRSRGVCSHVTPHMFRHTFATMLLEQDVDIRYIQHILGHSSIATTQIYTHVSSTKQREILKVKNPRLFVKR